MRKTGCLSALALALVLSGCSTAMPTSFSRTVETGWTSIEVRDGVDFDRAWETVFGLLARDFDIATAMKDVGYVQTGWLHTWSGVYQSDYKVRATVKFAADKKSLQVRSEAWLFDGETWITGTDSRLTSTLKTDLMGTVGRTTR